MLEGKRQSNLNVPLAMSSKAETTTVTLSVLAACQEQFVPLIGNGVGGADGD